MVDPGTPASVKLRAADSVLEHSASELEQAANFRVGKTDAVSKRSSLWLGGRKESNAEQRFLTTRLLAFCTLLAPAQMRAATSD